jgi:hypothetical protein
MTHKEAVLDVSARKVYYGYENLNAIENYYTGYSVVISLNPSLSRLRRG